MASENFTIVVRADGTQSIKRQFDDIARSADQVTRGLFLMRRALRTLSVGVVAHEFVQLVDSFTNIKNRLGLVTTGIEDLNNVTNQLLKISNETRTSFAVNAELFNRMTLAVRGFGFAQADLLKVTETLNKAIIVSGAGVREANNALIQLSQGLAAGRLNGDELRSVLEQLPIVADVIGRELGVTRGELRKLGREGKITTEVIINAIRNAESEIAGRFAKTIPTIGQSFTILTNNLIALISEFDKATGSMQGLTKILHAIALSVGTLSEFIKENADAVLFWAKAAGIAATALATLFIARNVGGYLRSVQAATVATIKYRAAQQSAVETAKAFKDKAISFVNVTQNRLGQANDDVASIRRQQSLIAVEKQAAQQALNTAKSKKEVRLASEALRVALAKEQVVSNAMFTAQAQRRSASEAAARALKQEAFAWNALSIAMAAATIKARALSALQGLIAALGGGWGIAVTLGITALTAWATHTATARDVLEEYKALVDSLKGSFDTVTEAILNMSRAQAAVALGGVTKSIDDLKKKSEEAQTALDDVLAKAARRAEGSISGTSLTLGLFDEDFARNVLAYNAGLSSIEKFQAQMSLATTNGSQATRDQAQELLNAVNALLAYRDSLRDASQREKELSDRVKEAIGTTRDQASEIERLAKGSKDFSAALGSIREATPEFKEQDEIKKKLEVLRADRERALAAIPNVIPPLQDSPGGRAALAKAVNDNFEQGRRAISGFTEALDELKKKEQENALGGMSDRLAAVAKVHQEYNELDKAIRATLLTGATEAEVNEAIARSNIARGDAVRQALKADDERQAKVDAREDNKNSFTKEIEGLQQEIDLLSLSGEAHEQLAAIYKIEEALKADLDDSQRAIVSGMVSEIQVLEEQKRLYDQINGPLAKFVKSKQGLFRLLQRGQIDIAQYNTALEEMGIAMDDARRDATSRGVARTEIRSLVPELAEMDTIERDLARLEDLRTRARERVENDFKIRPLQTPSPTAGREKAAALTAIDLDTSKARDQLTGLADVMDKLDDKSRELASAMLDPGSLDIFKAWEEHAEILKEIDDVRQRELAAGPMTAGRAAQLLDAESVAGKQLIETLRNLGVERDKDREKAAAKKPTFSSELAELQKEVDLLRLSGREREVLAEILKIEETLTKANNGAKRELTATEEAQVRAVVELREVMEEMESIYEELTGHVHDLKVGTEALHNLWDQGRISLNQYVGSLGSLKLAFLEAERAANGFSEVRQKLRDLDQDTREADQIRRDLGGAEDLRRANEFEARTRRDARLAKGNPENEAFRQQVEADFQKELAAINEEYKRGVANIGDYNKELEEQKKLERELGAASVSDREAALQKVREEFEERAKVFRIMKAANVEGADQLLVKNEELLQQALANTNKEYDERAAKKGRSEKDDINDILTELAQENEPLHINGTLRDQLTKVYEIEDKLNRKLTPDEQAKVMALVETNKALEAQRALYEEMNGPLEDYTLKTAALQSLLDKGLITLDQYNQKMLDMKISLLDADLSEEGGFQRGLLKVQKDLNDFAKQSEQVVVNAFQSMEDALVEFVATGKMDFRSLVDSILRDLARLLIRKYIMAPLANLLGLDLGGGGIGGNGAGSLLGSGGSGGGGGGGGVGGLLGGITRAVRGIFGDVGDVSGAAARLSGPLGPPAPPVELDAGGGFFNGLKKVLTESLDMASTAGNSLSGGLGAIGNLLSGGGGGGGSGGASGAVDLAEGLLGLSRSNGIGTINSFLKAGGVDLNAAQEAWCAAFVNSSLEQLGIQGSGSNVANSFLDFGTKINPSDVLRGDILVQSRGLGLDQLGGHVGFATGASRMGSQGLQLQMLSGNTGGPGLGGSGVGTDWVNATQLDIRRATEGLGLLGNNATSASGVFSNLGESVTSLQSAAQNGASALAKLGGGLTGEGGVAGRLASGLQRLATGTDSTTSALTSVASGTSTALSGVTNASTSVVGGFGRVASALSSFPAAPMGGGGIFSGLGSLIGGIFGGGGGVSAQAAAALTTPGLYDKGGYTGPGSKMDVAGIVHKDEYVFNKRAVQRLGVEKLDKLHKAANMNNPGFWNGGWTGGAMRKAANSNMPGYSSGGWTGSYQRAGGWPINTSGAGGWPMSPNRASDWSNVSSGWRSISSGPSNGSSTGFIGASGFTGSDDMRPWKSGPGEGQRHAPARDGGTESGSNTKVRIINVFDPQVVGEYLATEEGERMIMNVMRRTGNRG